MSEAPQYPGYGNPCNGCGKCCKDQPCLISMQFDLWRADGCRALAYRAGRYWCDVIVNPSRISIRLAKIDKAARVSAIGVAGRCDAKLKETA